MRTGTFSLKTALEKLLGGPCYHMSEVHKHPNHIWPWHKAGHGEMPKWNDLFSGYIAAVDLPSALFWPELMKAYPDALVVLSYRDSHSWLESCRQTVFKDIEGGRQPMFKAGGNAGPAGPMASRGPSDWKTFVERTAMMMAIGEARLPGMRNGHASDASLKNGYEEYNARIRTEVPPERLLIWQAQEGWAPLCAALNLPVPDEPFPRTNVRQAWEQHKTSRPHEG